MKSLVLLICLLCSTTIFSQGNISNNDIIVTSDGQLIQAKVVKVTDEAISFNYPGESVINEINVSNLQKIVFASGRTQAFNASKATGALPKESSFSNRNNNPAEQKNPLIPKEDIYLLPQHKENTLAVIPFSFMKNGKYEDRLSGEATTYATSFLEKNASQYGIQVQSMNTTIDKLINSGINHKQLRESSPEDLRKILGTEFLLSAELKESSSQKNKNNASSFYSNSNATAPASSGTKTVISFKLYDATSEKYNVTFTEELMANEPIKNYDTPKQPQRWKSSMKYVLEQFLLSKSL